MAPWLAVTSSGHTNAQPASTARSWASARPDIAARDWVRFVAAFGISFYNISSPIRAGRLGQPMSGHAKFAAQETENGGGGERRPFDGLSVRKFVGTLLTKNGK
jgi:hypothetical protein